LQFGVTYSFLAASWDACWLKARSGLRSFVACIPFLPSARFLQQLSFLSNRLNISTSGYGIFSRATYSNNSFIALKEYFTKVVGPIKRCVITYGPNGHSRGIATVEFSRASDAATAAQKYNGVEVDRRPMKVTAKSLFGDENIDH